MSKLEDYIITIPDFPKEGIMFRDVTGILNSAEAIKMSIDGVCEKLEGLEYDKIVGPEARGFIFGMPVAYATNKSFVPIRKKGKLPREVISETYDLEYGTATVEIHKDSIKPGDKVVVIDDLLATGGTMEADVKLIERLGGEVVKIVFIIELAGLNGRERLKKYDVDSLVIYEGK